MRHNIDLSTFGEFMSALAELAYDVAEDFPSNEKVQKQKPKESVFVQTHTESAVEIESGSVNSSLDARTPKKPYAVCKMEGHRVVECSRFKSMDVSGRFNVVQQSGVCL